MHGHLRWVGCPTASNTEHDWPSVLSRSQFPAGMCYYPACLPALDCIRSVLHFHVYMHCAQGVYIGCSNGSVLCISPETGAVISTTAVGQQAVPAGAVDDGAAGASANDISISSLAVNKHWLAVACSGCPDLCFYQRHSSSSQGQLGGPLACLGTVRVSSIGEWLRPTARALQSVMGERCQYVALQPHMASNQTAVLPLPVLPACPVQLIGTPRSL